MVDDPPSLHRRILDSSRDLPLRDKPVRKRLLFTFRCYGSLSQVRLNIKSVNIHMASDVRRFFIKAEYKADRSRCLRDGK